MGLCRQALWVHCYSRLQRRRSSNATGRRLFTKEVARSIYDLRSRLQPIVASRKRSGKLVFPRRRSAGAPTDRSLSRFGIQHTYPALERTHLRELRRPNGDPRGAGTIELVCKDKVWDTTYGMAQLMGESVQASSSIYSTIITCRRKLIVQGRGALRLRDRL